MILYINNELVDLDPKSVIAQTKQVNDISSVDSREINYTMTFQIPKTANNLRLVQFMSMPGNQSNVPYQKNECALYSSSGECFIYKGWATITDKGETFEVYLQDGIIDFFKAIENKTLAELDLSEIQHPKTVANVIASWNEEKPYRYILADYNGDTGIVNTEADVTPSVNIDYLVPSVNVAWLWNKIKEAYSVTFTGSVFDTYNFTGLWMTYPKGISISGENDRTIFKSTDCFLYGPAFNSFYAGKWNSFTVNELAATYENIHMEVGQTGTYKVKIKGKFFGRRGTNLQSEERNARVIIGKNGEGSENYRYTQKLRTIGDNISFGTDYEYNGSDLLSLQEGDSICIIVTGATDNNNAFNILSSGPQSTLEIELLRVDPNVIDFSDAFTDFNIKDFIKEILQRFSLTMFKDKYDSKYEFLTLREQLVNASTVDWSDKLAAKGAENYIYGGYAQRNWFRYNYNDKESTHNDGFIDVANINLEDSKDVIKSKIYSPERIEYDYLNAKGKIYKLWDKEIVENPGPNEEPVKYTSLDKRYYFLRSVQRFDTIKVISKQLAGQDVTTNMYYRENYYMLPFSDILQEYYSPLQQILTKAVIVDVQLNLSEIDVVNFDFKKLYFFKQLGSYYIINKINNYIPGRLTKCELVRVIFTEIANPPQSIKINKIVTEGNKATIYFEMAVQIPWVQLEYKRVTTWNGINIQSGDNPYPITLSTPGPYTFRIKAGDVYSNELQISIPSSGTVTP